MPQRGEIEFLLKTTGDYLDRQPTIDDVLSVFTGIRPLVKGDKSARTASLSRDHVNRIAESGLVTITGGKWTTVRKMAEDCVNRAALQLDCIAVRAYQQPEAARLDQRIKRQSPRLSRADLAAIEKLEAENSRVGRSARSVADHSRFRCHLGDASGDGANRRRRSCQTHSSTLFEFESRRSDRTPGCQN